MNRRRGVSLTELLVVMGTSMVALTTAVRVLHQTMTCHQTAEKESHVQLVAQRLTAQFRQDVHAAETVEWSGAGHQGELRLSWSDATSEDPETEVVYSVRGGELTRVARSGRLAGETVESDNRVHRETFSFGDDFRIDLTRSDSPDRLRLTVGQYRLPAAARALRGSRFPDEEVEVRTVAHIEAIVGKHRPSSRAAPRNGGDP